MLQPKRTKYRKYHKSKNRGYSKGCLKVSFGEFGLKAASRGRLTARQIEAGRRAITRHIRRSGRVWTLVYPHQTMTHKPAEVRQGGGKGPVEYWFAKVAPGRVLYELEGVPEPVARRAFQLAAAKFPVRTVFEHRVVK